MDFNNIFAYTRALDKNNNRPWFHDNHRQYEQAQADFYELVEQLKLVLIQESPALGESVMFTQPKALVYRIPRDMRYSMGKEPYNPAFRAYFSPDKKAFLPLSYYFFVSHEGCYVSTGAYPWTTAQLTTLREYIMYNYEELDRIVAEGGLEMEGRELKRAPRGYDAEHPAVEWLKYKRYLASVCFTEADTRDFESFCKATALAVRRLEPLRIFLSEAFTGPEPDDEELY